MNKVKDLLLFINAHRDGCTGSLISESLKMHDSEVVDLLRQMHKDQLIEINNTTDPTEDDFLSSLILISGAYYHPDYSNIF